MTSAYMHETADFLQSKGFELTIEQKEYCSENVVRLATIYHLKKGAEIEWGLEDLSVDATNKFFLEIKRHHGLKSFSTALDSWKYFDSRIEFKYQPTEGRTNALSLMYSF